MAPPTNGDSISGHDLAATYKDQIKDKVILMTGTSQNSLGEEYCLAIAKFEPKLLILAGRNAEKLEFTTNAIAKVNPNVATKTLNLNLESLSEVKEAADIINSWDDVPYIDVFCHNAAIMGTAYGTTMDGFERQLGVNYIATWVFTNTILPKILKSQDPRIVLLGSDGHRWGPIRWHDHNFKGGENYNKWHAYGQSKTAVHLYALHLGKVLGKKAQVFSLNPGVIQTPLGAHVDWASEFRDIIRIDLELGNDESVNGWPKYKSREAGIATSVYASFDPDLADYTGAYLSDCQVANPYVHTVRPWASSEVEATKLWKWTEQLTNARFSF
ncbi:oxidoreductase calI [Trichoderma asperellum]|uniref:Oxidoreductase calI n=1 Tax=Trichoderma asperellum TaxID=101201 RepID=A0A6V8R6F7_TRIAP|nr:oxidoreductase calI [Trichoderma asperellum]